MTSEEIAKGILSIHDAEEMDSFLSDNYGDIYYSTKSLGRNNEVVKNIINVALPDVLHDFLIALYEEDKVPTYVAYFLYDIFKTKEELFHLLIKECPNVIKSFYNLNMNKEDITLIMRSLNDEEKAEFIIIYSIDSIDICFQNREELKEFIKRIPYDKAVQVFKKLDLQQKKCLIMSDLSEDLILYLIKYDFDDALKNSKNEELKKFILDSFISTYNKNHKTGLLLLLNFIDYSRNNSVTLENTSYSEEAFFSEDRLDSNFLFSNDHTISIPKSTVSVGDKSVLFHEFGHYFFRIVANKKHPKEYEALIAPAQDHIMGDGNKKTNDIQLEINEIVNILTDKFQDKSIAELLQKILYIYISKNIKENLIDYMKRQNYDESLIKMIEERFSEFDIQELTDVAKYDEIKGIIHKVTAQYLGGYYCYEDLINSIFGGSISYLDVGKVDRTTIHPTYYYNGNMNKQFNEGIANFVSICLLGNAEALKLLKELIGNELYEVFEEMYLSFALSGISEDDIELREKIKQSLLYDSGINLKDIKTQVQNISRDDLIKYLSELSSRLFTEPKRSIQESVSYSESDSDFIKNFTTNKNNLSEEELLEQRIYVYMKLTKEEKETIIKLDSLDIKTKQELIRHDAKELFWSNDEDVSAMNSLLDKLFIINTDVLSIFQLIENIREIIIVNPDFSLYKALYGEESLKTR